MYPLKNDDSPGDGLNYGFALVSLEAELQQAFESGALPVKDHLTYGPHVGHCRLEDTWVRVADLQVYLVDRLLFESDSTPSDKSEHANTAKLEPEVAASIGPAPLTTNEIANCFAGLRGWDVTRWKRELGSPDVWLKACRHVKGTRGRGGYESTWLPVQIAIALVKGDPKTDRALRARFKKQEPLKPWFDMFEINIPDNSDSQ
jgi:hypothetical protein